MENDQSPDPKVDSPSESAPLKLSASSETSYLYKWVKYVNQDTSSEKHHLDGFGKDPSDLTEDIVKENLQKMVIIILIF